MRTCSASRSGSAYTATEPMPASLQARITRTAISPRFATSTFCNGLMSVTLAPGLSSARVRWAAYRPMSAEPAGVGLRGVASAGTDDRVQLDLHHPPGVQQRGHHQHRAGRAHPAEHLAVHPGHRGGVGGRGEELAGADDVPRLPT